jgi:hypothetical protein
MRGRACGSGCMLGAMYQSFRQINEPISPYRLSSVIR